MFANNSLSRVRKGLLANIIDGGRPGGRLPVMKTPRKQREPVYEAQIVEMSARQAPIVPARASDIRARREARDALASTETSRGPDFDDPALAASVARVHELEKKSHAPRTVREYEKAFSAFDFWCRQRGYTSVPATVDSLRLYLTDQASGPTERTESGKKPRSIGVMVAAIAYYHNARGFTSPHTAPIIKTLLKGIRNEKGLAPKQKAPVETDVLLTLLKTIDADLRDFEPRALAPEAVDSKNRARAKDGRAKQVEAKRLAALRDRALFLTAFGGALRRAEATALTRDHLRFEKDGLKVWIKESKTDQEKRGDWVFVPKGSNEACPLKAMQLWLSALEQKTGTNYGPVFVSIDQWANVGAAPLYGNDVARILKRRGASAGFITDILAGHSFRSGFATSAAKAGKALSKIMEQGRWKKADTALGYIRMAEGFVNNPADGLFTTKDSDDE